MYSYCTGIAVGSAWLCPFLPPFHRFTISGAESPCLRGALVASRGHVTRPLSFGVVSRRARLSPLESGSGDHLNQTGAQHLVVASTSRVRSRTDPTRITV